YSGDMQIIIGLGNPGKEYQNTRHNAGFMALDAIGKEYNFPAFRLSQKDGAMLSEGAIGPAKVLLAKPQTFMNNSGSSVGALSKNYPLKTKNLLLVHDDIDLPLGSMKIASNKGSAGHKGVESIIQNLGTKDFTRIRVGICPSGGKPGNVEDFVLQKFAAEELPQLQTAIQATAKAIFSLLQ
ncbi:MAG: aminoacyl-tRNA hydrolase, partial [Candidatus Wildermuthbacteria bacterium]|nr:aminoacyl-tRNA hydrolase [Candidatus Wildermuthbacteria bacterium]